MSGTISGGKRTAATNKERYGENYYRMVGKLGGKVKVPKGFAITGLAREAGAKGGRNRK